MTARDGGIIALLGDEIYCGKCDKKLKIKKARQAVFGQTTNYFCPNCSKWLQHRGTLDYDEDEIYLRQNRWQKVFTEVGRELGWYHPDHSGASPASGKYHAEIKAVKIQREYDKWSKESRYDRSS